MPPVAATYALNSIVDRIIMELERKIKQWRGVENESASLQEDLNRLVAQMDIYLKEWRREPSNPVARNDFQVMRDLVHDMEDCIEGFLSEIKREKKKGGLEGVIPDAKHWMKKTGVRDKFSTKIRKIKKRAEEARNRRSGDPAAVVRAGPAPVGHRRDPVAEDNPVGIAMAREDLCALLQDEVYGEPKKLRVISIVGFGGSGKTTLVRAVFRSLTIGATRRFARGAWVDRADYNNPGDLLKSIIRQFWEHVHESTNERELKDYINQNLGRQRYLIVLDDMEDTDPIFWGWIQSTFIDKGISSRIVVITSMLSIGQQCSSYGNGFVYKMRTIGDRGCNEIAFPGHRAPDDPASQEQMLLKICDGLPLALVSVANDIQGLAPGAVISDRCETLCREFGSFLLEEATEMNQMAFANLRGVLMDHYVGLTGNTTRPCLLYLGIFSDGRRLKKNKITRRWVAEGYAETNDPQHREKEASKIFHQLMDRNFIQPNGISSSTHTYRALGVVQEFVLHRSSSDRFLMHCNYLQQVPPGSNGSRKVRHIFLENFNGQNRNTLDDVDLGRVRSLTLSGSAGGYISKFSKFKKSKLMRVLDLEKCTDVNASHLQDICKQLHNLRYLNLGSNIGQLPEEITRLDLLESLHLSKSEVIELPVEVIAMPCLTVLIGKFRLPYNDGDEDKHRHAIELSRNSKLQTLAGFDADGHVGFLLLMPYMKNLKKVKIWCNSGGNIRNLNTQLLQAIQWYTYTTQQQNRRSLCIHFQGCTPNDLAVLQELGANSFFEATANINNLSSLKLHGNLPVLPMFVTTLQGLADVCLSLTTVTDDVLSTMGTLRHLVCLKLVADGIVAVADVVTIREGFQSLKSLCFVIHGNDQVPQIHVQDGALPELVSLQLLYMGLAGFSGIRYLRSLREIELHPNIISGTARRELEKAAQNHPNRPNILPFLRDDDHDVQDQPRPLIAQRIYGILDSWVQRLHPRNFYTI